MRVLKFGGGILKDPSSIGRIPAVLGQYGQEPLAIVISAFGKTTNALEEIIRAAWQKESLEKLTDQLKKYHLDIARALFSKSTHPVFAEINILFEELEKKLTSLPGDNFDKDYDLVICTGELLSTRVIHHFLNQAGYRNVWKDARELIFTDNNFRQARVDMGRSQSEVSRYLLPYLSGSHAGKRLIVTQGFIGSTPEGESTSLGREGSDYTAAILANLLDAGEVIIWKDVPGIMNADPDYFPATIKLDRISYSEATELAYYGAKVIHPKTTRPIQLKGIPMIVRSFFDLDDAGTTIQESTSQDNRIPSFIVKNKQVLISVTTRDLAFISEKVLHDIFAALSRNKLNINVMQNSALTLSFCTDENRRISELINELQVNYSVRYNDGLELITIRHHTPEAVDEVRKGREVILEQQNRTVFQLVVR